MTFTLFMHHIVFVIYFFCANLQSTLGFFVSFISLYFVVYFLVLILTPCLGRLEQIGLPPFPLCLPLEVSCLGMTDAERFLRN